MMTNSVNKTEPAGTEPAITVEPTGGNETPVAPEPSGTETEVVPNTGDFNCTLATSLLDFEVWDQDGSEQLGSVEELILNFDNVEASYIVVASRSEDAERVLPVPIELFSCDNTERVLILEVDLETFENAPEFSGGEIPDTSQQGWDGEFNTYWNSFLFGAEAYPTP
jgi:hypothetical protein